MTQLLSLFNQVFGNQSKSNDLEQFIISRNPNSHQQVEELTRDYMYHYPTSRGAITMQKIEHALHDLWDAWVEARTAYAKQYVIRNGHMD